MGSKLSHLRIAVLGYLIRGPLGGMAWHHLQYVLGLSRLGHDVWFVEDSDDTPLPCYDPVRDEMVADPGYGLQFASECFARLGLSHCWAYYDAHTSGWVGPRAGAIRDLWSSADLVINVSGANPLRPWSESVPVRVYIDTDPVFTQIGNLTTSGCHEMTDRHTRFFSFGECIGGPGCSVPMDGFAWLPTRQPIVLDAWPVVPGPVDGQYSSVLQWDSYPAAEYGGRRYGMKSDSFGRFMPIPQKVGRVFELAVGSSTAPRDELRRNGWLLRNPLEVARDPWTYQAYIQGSKAEFTVAKHGYVEAHSGWFSERSAAYLASARPVLTQDTGFSDWLATGKGVVAFDTVEEAVAGVKEINSRYQYHCTAARELAEEYFDSTKVLSSLLERAMGSTPRTV